jgi:ABC-type transporter Mla subunit MlaD
MNALLSLSTGYWLIMLFGITLFSALPWTVRSGREKAIPSISISLGITFTFIGIFIALLGFNVNDIQGSIPQLLDGMRLAFFTSIIGMVVAVIYRVSPNAFNWMRGRSRRRRKRRSEVATVEDLDAAQARRHDKTKKQLEDIHRALAGNGDATLITQLQKLRTSLVDKQDEMLQAFNTFAEKVAEDQTEALIEALSDVIRDFNAKINEQFGENFKQLNEAVGRLLDWQKKYAEQVEQMNQQLNQSLQGIQKSEEALGQIKTHSLRFTEVANELETVIAAFHQEIEVLEQHLEAFAELGQTAKDAFPQIEKNIEGITTTYKEHVEHATKQMKESSDTQQRAVSKLLDTLKTHQEETNSAVEQMVEQTSENIANQIDALDEELGEELNKALKSLGNQLASLSEKFVKDYRPLTRELQRLVESSKRINGGHTS